ncbi:putative coiled-coil domain-containing protein 195 [Peromyscus californicus insignis]|uniref:putative coiled-coil domain-containing protein 195 n=1 Tax=Peromyscus californicus insignis TaxID=564181 RepID=UPI0022A7EAA2|nr:putative coiled-coil domain-containing protein 195 [Peromyscus californicus insignis]
MEASIQLLQVIQEMRAEINRLQKENHALRVKLTSNSQTASGSERESEDEREEAVYGQSPGALPGGIPTGSTPAVQEQGNVMIVRRYSISPSAHSYAASDPWKARNRLPNITGASSAHPSTRNQDNEEKSLAADGYNSNSSSQRASSDHSFVCREKTKTVSFQLPRDGSSVPKNLHPLKYSTNQTTDQLSIVAEKDV